MLTKEARLRPQIKQLLSARTAPEAGAAIATFLSSFSIDDCTDDQLLALGDLGQRARNSQFAQTALGQVIARGRKPELAHYKLGRLALGRKDYRSALEHFESGIAASAEFPHNFMGAARALRLVGRTAEACIAAERFSAFNTAPHRMDDVALLEELADERRRLNGHDRVAPVHEVVVELDDARETAGMRRAVSRVVECDPGIPAELLEALWHDDNFDRALLSTPIAPHLYYEIARVQEHRDDIPNAARNLVKCYELCLDGLQTSQLSEAQTASFLRVAHRCFAIERDSAIELYRCVDALGVRDYLSDLRIIEAQIDAGQIGPASKKMTELAAYHTLDPWGMFAQARIQFAEGDVALAVATAIAAGNIQPGNNYCKIVTGYRLLDFAAIQQAQHYFESELTPLLGINPDHDKEINGLRFRLSVMVRDHAKLLELCRTPGFLAGNPNWLTVEALFTFALPGEQINPLDVEVATELADFLEANWPYSLGAVLSLYQFYSRRRMWSKVTALEQRISGEPVFGHHEVVMRRFETLCTMSRMEEAKEFYRVHYRDADLRQWESCVVLRFLAEAKMWDDTARLLEKFIANRYYFPDGDFFLLKICRRSGLHRSIISIIDAKQGPEAPAQFQTLRGLLVDDLIIKGAEAKSPAGGDEAELVLSSRNRVLFKRPLNPDPDHRTVAFLCADKAYYMSLLTFLASFVYESPGSGDIAWYVFLATDVPKGWGTILKKFSAKLGLALTVVPEKDFVSGDAIHVENYGIFTGGNTLSRAAFLRIYAAKYLYSVVGGFERALYVDSDIVCQHDFAPFAALDFDGALLMARAEEPSPEVQSVVERHGIPDMRYFNSGVLSFNFAYDGILDYIDEAIRLAETESERLVFHDQCALNIAFAGKVRYLEPEYNYFLRPHRPDNGDFAAATLLHFLDKPKPWDLSYKREYRALWIRHAETVRALLSAEEYNMIVAAANQ